MYCSKSVFRGKKLPLNVCIRKGNLKSIHFYLKKIVQEEKTTKTTNTWSLNSIQVNNQWVTEETKEEIKKYLKTNKSENTMIQNPWDATKAILSSKLIVIPA